MPNRNYMSNEYFSLLKEWCDAMLELQITDMKRPEFYGGLMCPSCARIHGRCADAMYPMMYMADATGDSRYLESAKMLFDWVEYNMRRPDGSYYNDTNSTWRGITVFASIQLGEALYYHGHLLDEKTRQRWVDRLDSCAQFLSSFIENIDTNVNYPITCSASLAVAGKVLGKAAYTQQANRLAKRALALITPEGLIYGEGHPHNAVTAKNCRPVDLGYNVEESLSGLVTYALFSGDESVLEEVQRSMLAHLQFMLPDGAWDNSWGTRSAKWTYWGSRTSDGCQIAYGLLADRNPLFGEAAHRNFELYKACTFGGLLHGGPMYATAGEAACSHHTFCHAKALTAMLDHHFEKPLPQKLPREAAQGVTTFSVISTSLIAKGPWRATVTDYDFDSVVNGHATGGALTMLWHEKAGRPIALATMTEYQLTEPNNMQLPQYYDNICQTPRILYRENGVSYLNINDKKATMTVEDGEVIRVHAKGHLVDAKGNGDKTYSVDYTFAADKVSISLSTNAEGAVFYLPVVSEHTEPVEMAQKGGVCTASVIASRCTTVVSSEENIKIDETIPLRTFNPVGGFETVMFYIDLAANKQSSLEIEVR